VPNTGLTRTTSSVRHPTPTPVCVLVLTLLQKSGSTRNFIIDVRRMPVSSTATGLHWQVSQATSLINVRVEMSQVAGNNHQVGYAFTTVIVFGLVLIVAYFLRLRVSSWRTDREDLCPTCTSTVVNTECGWVTSNSPSVISPSPMPRLVSSNRGTGELSLS